MKKAITALSLFLFSSCEYIGISPRLEFLVINKSSTDIAWVKLLIQDTKEADFPTTNVGDPIEIATFTKVEEKSDIISIKLEEFSKTGHGGMYVLVKREGSSDTLRNGMGNYKYFRDSQDSAPSGWRTREIFVYDSGYKQGEVVINLVYYKNGKYVRGYRSE